MNALRVVVTIGAVLLSSNFQPADAASCELMKIFAAVKPLESNTNVAACIAATGYEMLPPTGPPTDAQLAKLCGATSCISVFNTLQKMDIPDCTIDILGGLNVKQVFDGVAAKCGSVTGSSSNAASSTPAPSSATPTVAVAKSTTQASQPLAPATAAPAAKATTATTAPAAQVATTAPAAPVAAGSGSAKKPAAATAEPTIEPKLCV